jgi:hypothetical protein
MNITRYIFFQPSFTHRTAQFTWTIPQFPQFTCSHCDSTIPTHSTLRPVSNNAWSIPFQPFFTHRTAQFAQTVPQFRQFTCPHPNSTISRHSTSLSISINPFSRWTSHDISLSSHLSHTELCCSLEQFHSSLSLPAHTTMAPSQCTQPHHPFLAIHSGDEHRTMYIPFQISLPNSTFYAFFSPFWITLWLMWLANNKWQPCFYPPQSLAQEDTQNWPKKLTNLMGNLCCAREHSVQFFVQIFYAVKLHTLT